METVIILLNRGGCEFERNCVCKAGDDGCVMRSELMCLFVVRWLLVVVVLDLGLYIGLCHNLLSNILKE